MDIKELQKLIVDFNSKRGWRPSMQDCAKSIIIEGAELLEHFQFDNTSSRGLGQKKEAKDLEEISLEIADVFWYMLSLCEVSGINLEEALLKQIERAEEKYPEKEFRGIHNEEFYARRKKEYRNK